MSTDPALSQAQSCDAAKQPTEEQNSFRFTPIKVLRAIPRLWERKPASPFQPGLKRKLWKRFQSTFTNMQTVESSAARDDDALQTAINTSKDSAYVRGVKRLCVGSEGSENQAPAEVPQTRRPFVETKWESEASRKKRKIPNAPFDIYDETSNMASTTRAEQKADERYGHHDVDADGDLAMTSASPIILKSLRSLAKPIMSRDMTPSDDANITTSDAKFSEQIESRLDEQEQFVQVENTSQQGPSDMAPTPTKIVRNQTQIDKGTLVRSALRSSLDGEDVMLLNDFLSKAIAKRTAKASIACTEQLGFEEEPGSAEESPDSECATPRSRRALEDRDANTPSPTKAQITSVHGDFIPGDESHEEVAGKNIDDEEDAAPASLAPRRSTRVKAPPANAPPVPNTISLRRAQGTEFIFMQRTEAQELALTTQRNTKHNKGNSLYPKAALRAMAEGFSPSTDSDIQGQNGLGRKTSGSRRATSKPQKTVTWNAERMVEYEGGLPTPLSSDEVAIKNDERDESNKCDADGATSHSRSRDKRSRRKVSTTGRRSRSQVSQEMEAESAPVASAFATAPVSTTAAPVSRTPKSRRVRKLGDSVMTSCTPVKTGSGRISKLPTTSGVSVPAVVTSTSQCTPTKPRRKLVPKSPSSTSFSPPANKASSRHAADAHFVSGIPTRAVAGSEGTKRKVMGETYAGCTPMPKRVRARS